MIVLQQGGAVQLYIVITVFFLSFQLSETPLAWPLRFAVLKCHTIKTKINEEYNADSELVP